MAELPNNNKKSNPTDLLSLLPEPHLITDKLPLFDFIRFGSVNKSWRSIYTAHPRHSLPHQLPLLMIPALLNNQQQIPTLYQPTHKISTYTFRIPIPQNGFCAGSTHGWLMIVSENREVRLLNPFLLVDNEIQLPSLLGFVENASVYYVKKMTLSDKPALSSTSFVVMIIHGVLRSLAFFSLGGVSWSRLNAKYDQVDDVICCGGRFYFVNWSAEVFVCDVDSREVEVSLVSSCPYTWPNNMPMLPRNYLVELSSGGELLLVRRIRKIIRHVTTGSIKSYNTSGFFVYKLDPLIVEQNKWVEVQSLSGHALFLGDNSSFSVLASDFHGCKPNCIYFTDDLGDFKTDRHSEGPHDLGVFNLETVSIEPHYPLKKPCKFVSPPIWLEPTPPRRC